MHRTHAISWAYRLLMWSGDSFDGPKTLFVVSCRRLFSWSKDSFCGLSPETLFMVRRLFSWSLARDSFCRPHPQRPACIRWTCCDQPHLLTTFIVVDIVVKGQHPLYFTLVNLVVDSQRPLDLHCCRHPRQITASIFLEVA